MKITVIPETAPPSGVLTPLALLITDLRKIVVNKYVMNKKKDLVLKQVTNQEYEFLFTLKNFQ